MAILGINSYLYANVTYVVMIFSLGESKQTCYPVAHNLNVIRRTNEKVIVYINQINPRLIYRCNF